MALHIFGTKLELSPLQAGFTEQTLCRKIHFPEFERKTANVTVLKSASMFMEYIRSWVEGDKVTWEVLHTSTIYNTLYKMLQSAPNQTADQIRLTFPLDVGENNAANLVITGFLIKLGEPEAVAGEDTVYACQCEFKTTSIPTFTPSS